MEIKQFVIDAFTDRQFGGNPAAVCILQDSISDELMQNIALENALPETAFIISNGGGIYDIKWFTPRIEMDLCGHATLASAHVLWQHLEYKEDNICFNSKSGKLKIIWQENYYAMNFPSRIPEPTILPDVIKKSLNIQPVRVLKSRDYVLIYEDERQVRELSPDEAELDSINLDPGGIVVTAPGNEVDFVSRFFTPQDRIFEDPVTGSSHTSLIPYWSKELGKSNLKACQLSRRDGTLFCEDLGDRVLIGGNAKTYSEGTVFLEI